MQPQDAAQSALRQIPSVDGLTRHPLIEPLLQEFPRAEVITAIRRVVEALRQPAASGAAPDVSAAALGLAVRGELQRRGTPSLRRVINATGVVLHTGLGRAPLAPEAIEAINSIAGGYCNLELDLSSGQRGDRHGHLRELLRELTGAEDALVVNNNAAATMLALRALAFGEDVLVSRGELVEIGGSYRMPDIMEAAGCRLVEVGTTNRTRIADFAARLTPQTRVLLRVHASNYRIVGFTQAASLRELVELARHSTRRDLYVVDDLGSGLLDADVLRASDGSEARAWDEPSVRDSMRAGADLALFSGDKLLGGPQAGILVGRADLIARLRSNPLTRAMRPDKLTIAALEATLRLYRDPHSLASRCPTLGMLLSDASRLRRRAERLAALIAAGDPAIELSTLADQSFAGGGALPTIALPTWIVRVSARPLSAQALMAGLRAQALPVIARVQDEHVVLDCRTVREEEVEEVAAALLAALQEARQSDGFS